jgi:hypothetical protein
MAISFSLRRKSRQQTKHIDPSAEYLASPDISRFILPTQAQIGCRPQS